MTALIDSPGPILSSTPIAPTARGLKHRTDQGPFDTQNGFVGAAPSPGSGQDLPVAHDRLAAAGTPDGTGSGNASAVADTQTASALLDPVLALAADTLDDLERVRIATQNRARSLVQVFGIEGTAQHAAVVGLVAGLEKLEHDAELTLKRTLRKHPLGLWIKATVGIGEKQGARLLAAIGDPYIRPEITRADGTVEPSRPRTVSELWALCGYHVVHTNFPVDHRTGDAQRLTVGGEPSHRTDHMEAATQVGSVGAVSAPGGGDTDQGAVDAQNKAVGVAPARARGQLANWSSTAKMRAFLIAESCIKQSKSPYRAVYDAGRVKYADAVHAVECRRCGPRGKPAAVGTSLPAGHQHARAMRLVSKEILKDLWRESKRLHAEGDN